MSVSFVEFVPLSAMVFHPLPGGTRVSAGQGILGVSRQPEMGGVNAGPVRASDSPIAFAPMASFIVANMINREMISNISMPFLIRDAMC
jgi:hypothetical protein